jgi:hypothetical protein
MTSERKAQANRDNARKSTCPKTPRGKVRAARNARRLGLSVPVLADPVLCEQVAMLTREIAGETSNDNIRELARRIAVHRSLFSVCAKPVTNSSPLA